MTEHVVVGPCLTRAEAARRAGITSDETKQRPDLLRLRGRWLQETYFAFQFDERGVRPDLGRVVMDLRGRHSEQDIADWLVRPNRLLDNVSPLRWMRGGHGPAEVLDAAHVDEARHAPR